MSHSLLLTLLLSAVSGVLTALGCFVRPLGRLCAVLCLVWLAAALPVMFFLKLAFEYVLLFYLISSALGLIFLLGGRPA